MRAHFLQHVPFEGLGHIHSWLTSRGAEITGTRFFLGEPLPEPEGIDLVVVMGGPMSVNDEEEHPWLKEEKEFVRRAIGRGIPVLGVCLGAQLIANALGARVFPNPQKEIGWFPIEGTRTEGTFRFPEKALVLHWHGETFDLPPKAVRLARSAACDNQAFQVGARAIGLQFHLEMTPESAAEIIGACAAELVPAPYVQPEEELRNVPLSQYRSAHALLEEILTYLTRVE